VFSLETPDLTFTINSAIATTHVCRFRAPSHPARQVSLEHPGPIFRSSRRDITSHHRKRAGMDTSQEPPRSPSPAYGISGRERGGKEICILTIIATRSNAWLWPYTTFSIDRDGPAAYKPDTARISALPIIWQRQDGSLNNVQLISSIEYKQRR